MFLKRIELQGFKSFADKTIVHFDHNMIGIVGPNGCGKSNINDAIRWVLGEQSVKSLRGNSMSDVIFSGSKSKKSVNIAKVSLIFNNTNRYFDLDFDEVEITRCLHRVNNENEYFINKTPCRLKDIVNLVMDSGLGKDSLSIISQGNISSFAEAKPIERRAIFEEAASVAKYKKRKIESLGKLDRTNENLIRLEDIIIELEKQLEPLKKQADKASIFVVKEKRLREIEISVIVDNISLHQNTKEQHQNRIYDFTLEITQKTSILDEKELQSESTRKSMYQLDFEINKLQEDLVAHLNRINQLEARKIELEEKRKYQKNSEDNQVRKQLLFEELQEINFEFENRNERLSHLQQSQKFNLNELESLNMQITSINDEIRKITHYLGNVRNELTVNQKLIEQPFLSQVGVKNIMEAKHIRGIHNTISNLFVPKQDYEKAIQSALNSIMYHIIVENSEVGKNAIHYLKKNNAGRATFIPLDLLKPRFISKENEIVAASVTGYLGVASDFVECDLKYQNANLSLLGNILIASDIDNANELAQRLKHQFKIITLDGDVIHKGGSMSGGSMKQNSSVFILQKEKEQLTEKEQRYNLELEKFKAEHLKLISEKNKLESENLKLQLDFAKLSTVVESMKQKKEKIETEFNQISADGELISDVDMSFVAELSNAYQHQDEMTSLIQNKRSIRYEQANQLELLEQEIRNFRREISHLNAQKQQSELECVKASTKLEIEFDILRSTYSMTYDYALTQVVDIDIQSAREEVLTLKNEISKLGNINLDAPQQYEEVSTRYESLRHQTLELNEAKSSILKAIDEMDEMMKIQFKEMFNKINDELHIVFKSLFPSGTATLTLVEPDDLLNTGIDIEVSFPGKTLKNIRLFSGGEKALVAICVLFAIIRARTMPLCIFDEVEAALDQVNVDKFANYISTLKDETQFIVVTHRPGTMVKCDALFGVTMQQSGVSNILSVKMEDALNLVKESK